MKCFAENSLDEYIGESAIRVIERVKDHARRDAKSHVLKHTIENEHVEVTQKDFEIISNCFKSNRLKRKVVKTLIKQECPFLNVQDQSVELKLLT